MARILVNILAGIGVLALMLAAGAVAFVIFVNSGSDITVKESLVAPGAGHTATLYTGMGGGAAGWCSQTVSVNPTTAPFSTAMESQSMDYRVYMGRCSIAPKLQWLSSSQLQISVPEFVQQEWTSASVKGRDKSGEINVTFEFTHN